MSKSDKNSCKKDCPCTSCKGSHNDLEEKFTDYAQTVVGRALASPGAADNAAMLGPAQSLGLSAAGVVAQDSLPHIKKAASRVANKVKRFAKGLKSKETRYRDFQDKVHGSSHWNPARGKAVRKGGDIAVSKGIDPGYYPWDKRPKALKIFEDTKKESPMSKPDIHSTFLHFVDNLENHKSGLVNEHGKEARTALEKGDYNLAKHYLDKGHDLSRHFDRIHTAASLLTKSKDDDAVTHAKDSLLNLHSGYFKKAQHHLDVATTYHNREIQESKEVDLTPLTKVGATKTGEKLVPEKRKSPSIPENPVTKVIAGKDGEEYKKEKQMSEDKYTRLAEAAFASLNQDNPFRTSNLMNEGHKVPLDEAKSQHPAQKNIEKHLKGLYGRGKVTIEPFPGKPPGHYSATHEAPDGETNSHMVRPGKKPNTHIVDDSPHVSSGYHDEEVEQMDEVSDERAERVARLRVGKTQSFTDKSKGYTRTIPGKEKEHTDAMNKQFKSIDRMGPERWAAARDRGVETELGINKKGLKEEFVHTDNLQELSKKTLGSYIEKAADDYAKSEGEWADNHRSEFSSERKSAARAAARGEKRAKGIRKAVARLTKEETMEEVEHLIDEVEHLDEVSDEKAERVARLRVGKTQSFTDKSKGYTHTIPGKEKEHTDAMKKQFKSIDRMGPERWSRARDHGVETELGIKKEEAADLEEGDVIQFKPKPTPKPSKVITTATRRPPGPRPVKENLNQRFPDVERDIAAIMKESYKKAKLKEDAMNIYIATPEQRNDWLEVGRGAMDVMDYINKYKV